jgi:hypothetical protein
MKSKPRSHPNRLSFAAIGHNVRRPKSRDGAVAVELAIVAPVLLAMTLGMVELTAIFDVQNLLETAAREGARFATLDKEGLLKPGETTNSKLLKDVKTFLISNGIDSQDVTVAVKDHEDPDADFDLEDPNNEFRFFEVHVLVDYLPMSLTPVADGDAFTLTGKIVFRNGMATITE